MANPNQSNETRRSTRVIAAGRNEKKQKKIQDRLARQEQKMAEKLERQTAEKTKKTKPTPTPAPPESHREPTPHKAKRASTGKRKATAKQTLHRVKDGFQVIVGGRRKRFVRLGAVLAALLAVIIFINMMVPVGLWEYIENMFAGFGSGDGFPVSVSTSEKSRLLSVGGDTALLGDSSLMLYKSNGKLLFERQHEFSEPAIAASTSRILVYDRGHTGVRIDNRAKTLLTLEAKGDITTATIAYNGYFAVVTKGGNYISDVTAYNEDGLEQYTWHSATRQVTGVALSDNGRYMAVTTLHVAGGEAVTGLLLFDIQDNATLFEQSYQGCLSLSLEFKDDVAVAILNDRVVSFDSEGATKEQVFENGRLISFDNKNAECTIVLLELFQNANHNQLLIFDDELTLTGKRDILTSGVAVSAHEDSVALLTNDKVVFYDHEAAPQSIVFLTADSENLVCHGNYAIVLEHHQLVEIKK